MKQRKIPWLQQLKLASFKGDQRPYRIKAATHAGTAVQSELHFLTKYHKNSRSLAGKNNNNNNINLKS